MDLTLRNDNPVQKNYISIPRPLYPEVKGYIEDLLNRGFIRKSKSPYSSSVVCVRKKDGGMRLCVDYRELNKNTIPDRHPIPRIQETLDGLGGKSWFTVLDQGKAYHIVIQSHAYRKRWMAWEVNPGLVCWIKARLITRDSLEKRANI